MAPPGQRRSCKQTPVAEKIEKLKIWQAHPDWGPAEAARQLGVNKSTLLGWRKALSDEKLSFIKEPDPGTGTFRKSGAGPIRKLKPYEFRVLEFYENCLVDGDTVRPVDILGYCQQIPEFVLQEENTQKSWAQRFINHYRPILKRYIPANGTATQGPAKTPKLANDGDGGSAGDGGSDGDSDSDSDGDGDGDGDGDSVADNEEEAGVQQEDEEDGRDDGGEAHASICTEERAVEIGSDEDAVTGGCNGQNTDGVEVESIVSEMVAGNVELESDNLIVGDGSIMVQVPVTLRDWENFLSENASYGPITASKTPKLYSVISYSGAEALAIMDMQKPFTVIPPEKIDRLLPTGIIGSCEAQVAALRGRQPELREGDVVVNVTGFGVITVTTLGTMTRWHRAACTLKIVDLVISWVKTLTFPPRNFQVPSDPLNVAQRLRELPLLSEKVELLDLAANGCLGDNTMLALMKNLFGARNDIACVNPGLLSVNAQGGISTNECCFKESVAHLSDGKILVPVNVRGVHWCGVMLNVSNSEVLFYDPLSSSDQESVRDCAKQVASMLPPPKRKRFRFRAFMPAFGVQTDTFNCGIYVMVAFQDFCGTEAPAELSRASLKYMRYSFLSACI